MLTENVSKINSNWVQYLVRNMSSPSTFSDLPSLDEVLGTYLLDDDYSLSWNSNDHLQELVCDKSDMEECYLPQPHPSAADFISYPTTPPSSHSEQDFSDQITDDDLMKLPIQELNKRLKKLPRAEVQKLRKRRRCLKNRSYATSCRQRRVASSASLKVQNQRLKEQVREIKESLSKAIKDRNLYRNKCERLQKLYQQIK